MPSSPTPPARTRRDKKKRSLTVANRFHLVKREQRGDIVHHREERILRAGKERSKWVGGGGMVRCVTVTEGGDCNRERYTER